MPALTPEEVSLYHESLDRAMSNPDFLDDFYTRFMSISDEIAVIFKNIDMAQLKRKLKISLNMVTLGIDDNPGIDMYLEYLGRVHKNLSVPESMFDLWIDSLIQTAYLSDHEFSPRLESIWRKALQCSVSYMHKAYHQENNRDN